MLKRLPNRNYATGNRKAYWEWYSRKPVRIVPRAKCDHAETTYYRLRDLRAGKGEPRRWYGEACVDCGWITEAVEVR